MNPPTTTDGAGSGRRHALLWIAAGAFAALLTAWAALLIVASRHPIAPVPVAAPGHGGR